MTDDRMTPVDLLETSFDDDLLGEMIGFTAQRFMALEVQGLTSAQLQQHRRRSRRPPLESDVEM